MNENPLELLRDDACPGTGLTPEGLVRAGRARVRRRRAVISGVAAALVLVVTLGVGAVAAARRPELPAHPDPLPSSTARPSVTSSTPAATEPAGPPCTQRALAVPGGGRVEKLVVDDTGHWFAGLLAGRTGVVIWHDGAVAGVADYPRVSDVIGVSSSGTAAGTGLNQGNRSRALTFHAGYVAELPLPADAEATAFTYAWGLDADGDVVGMIDRAAGRRQAIVWPRADPTRPKVLEGPGGAKAAAYAIGDHGEVGGAIDVPDNPKPYVWDADGTGHLLPVPAGAGQSGVNEFAGDRAADLSQGLQWSPGGPATVLPVVEVGGVRLSARDLTAGGTLLVSATSQAGLWRAGAFTELPVPTGSQYVRAFGMSADGTVVAGIAPGLLYGTNGIPLVWTCRPG